MRKPQAKRGDATSTGTGAEFGPLVPRIRKPGQRRRAIRKAYREQITAKGLSLKSKHAIAGRGKRTPIVTVIEKNADGTKVTRVEVKARRAT